MPPSHSSEKVTHGRHCLCGACAAEDWTNPDLAPCGMHGPDCPAEYDPYGRPGDEVHIDRIAINTTLDGFDHALIGRYPNVFHRDIGGQERAGSASYVTLTRPHKMQDCQFSETVTVTLEKSEAKAFIEATNQQDEIISRFAPQVREEYERQPLWTGRTKLKDALR